ncbi:hypothetical protein NMG60_11019160 [Bertholletia excelsa]
MANARIARFVTEVAPPQFVTIMRHRTSKMLDTINEEERDGGHNDSLSLSPKSCSSSSFSPPSTPTAAATAAASPAPVSSSNITKSKYLFKGLPKSVSIFGH